MKRILLSVAMIVFVGVAVAGATGAFFSDTESSYGNTFTAGAVDLKIDSVQHYNGMVCVLVDDEYEWVPNEVVSLDEENQPFVDGQYDPVAWNEQNPAAYPEAGAPCDGTWPLKDLSQNEVAWDRFFNFDDVKPGDFGENTISIHVYSNDAWMCASLDNVGGEDSEESKTEPELETGDDETGDWEGSELPDNLYFFAWVDDGDNVFEEEEQPLGNPTPASELENGTWALADSTTGNGPIAANGTQYIGLAWCLGEMDVENWTCNGEVVGNDVQTDSFYTDISFYVEQSRNNPDFVCANDPVVTEGSGWSPVDLEGKDWFAKAKVQEPNPASDFEVQVGVGDANPADFDQGDTEYPNSAGVPFTLVYDGAGTATFTANGEVTSYAVGVDAISNIGITVRAPADATTAVSGLALSTGALSDTGVSVTNGTNYLQINGAELDSGFTLSGTLTLTWTALTANGENQKMQISVN